MIIFNPPYLPIDSDLKIKNFDWIDIATNGGLDGLQIIFRFIEGSVKFLKKQGKAYFVFSSLTDRKKLEGKIKDSRLKYTIVKSQKFLDEKIDIYKIYF